MKISPNQIAQCALSHYEKVLPRGKGKPQTNREWTVYAAIVAVQENSTSNEALNRLQQLDRNNPISKHSTNEERNENNDLDLWVISCATGSKCCATLHPNENDLNKMKSCNKDGIEVKQGDDDWGGGVLHDSHAEVLARRGFMRLLWLEILMTLNDVNSSTSKSETKILDESKIDIYGSNEDKSLPQSKLKALNRDENHRRLLDINENFKINFDELRPHVQFRVRQGLSFHLYVSDAPCGDAAIYEIQPEYHSTYLPSSLSSSISRTEKQISKTDLEATISSLKKKELKSNMNFTGAKLILSKNNNSKMDPTQITSLLPCNSLQKNNRYLNIQTNSTMAPISPCTISESFEKYDTDNDSNTETKNRSTFKITHGIDKPIVIARESNQVLSALRTKSGRSNIPSHLRSTSMSCSDKICRWSILGLQGRLLSKYIPFPIVFSSICVSLDERVIPISNQVISKSKVSDNIERPNSIKNTNIHFVDTDVKSCMSYIDNVSDERRLNDKNHSLTTASVDMFESLNSSADGKANCLRNQKWKQGQLEALKRAITERVEKSLTALKNYYQHQMKKQMEDGSKICPHGKDHDSDPIDKEDRNQFRNKINENFRVYYNHLQQIKPPSVHIVDEIFDQGMAYTQYKKCKSTFKNTSIKMEMNLACAKKKMPSVKNKACNKKHHYSPCGISLNWQYFNHGIINFVSSAKESIYHDSNKSPESKKNDESNDEKKDKSMVKPNDDSNFNVKPKSNRKSKKKCDFLELTVGATGLKQNQKMKKQLNTLQNNVIQRFSRLSRHAFLTMALQCINLMRQMQRKAHAKISESNKDYLNSNNNCGKIQFNEQAVLAKSVRKKVYYQEFKKENTPFDMLVLTELLFTGYAQVETSMEKSGNKLRLVEVIEEGARQNIGINNIHDTCHCYSGPLVGWLRNSGESDFCFCPFVESSYSAKEHKRMRLT